MQKIRFVMTLLAGLMLSRSPLAALIDRGGGLIYDSALNITWLQDANYSRSSGYDPNGMMSWSQAMTWASNLNYYDMVRDKNLTGWRLPSSTPIPILTDSVGQLYPYLGNKYDGTGNVGFNITKPTSELSHLYYADLGNRSYYDTDGNFIGVPTVNAGPFINYSGNYWTNSDYLQRMIDPSGVAYIDSSYAVTVDTFGYQSGQQKIAGTSYFGLGHTAWAVRPGDVGLAMGQGSLASWCSKSRGAGTTDSCEVKNVNYTTTAFGDGVSVLGEGESFLWGVAMVDLVQDGQLSTVQQSWLIGIVGGVDGALNFATLQEALSQSTEFQALRRWDNISGLARLPMVGVPYTEVQSLFDALGNNPPPSNAPQIDLNNLQYEQHVNPNDWIRTIRAVPGGVRGEISAPSIGLYEASPGYAGYVVNFDDNYSENYDFGFDFTNLGDGDWLGVTLNDELIWSIDPSQLEANMPYKGTIPYAALAGKHGLMQFTLYSNGDANASVELFNVNDVTISPLSTVPEPSTLSIVFLGALTLAAARRRLYDRADDVS